MTGAGPGLFHFMGARRMKLTVNTTTHTANVKNPDIYRAVLTGVDLNGVKASLTLTASTRHDLENLIPFKKGSEVDLVLNRYISDITAAWDRKSDLEKKKALARTLEETIEFQRQRMAETGEVCYPRNPHEFSAEEYKNIVEGTGFDSSNITKILSGEADLMDLIKDLTGQDLTSIERAATKAELIAVIDVILSRDKTLQPDHITVLNELRARALNSLDSEPEDIREILHHYLEARKQADTAEANAALADELRNFAWSESSLPPEGQPLEGEEWEEAQRAKRRARMADDKDRKLID